MRSLVALSTACFMQSLGRWISGGNGRGYLSIRSKWPKTATTVSVRQLAYSRCYCRWSRKEKRRRQKKKKWQSTVTDLSSATWSYAPVLEMSSQCWETDFPTQGWCCSSFLCLRTFALLIMLFTFCGSALVTCTSLFSNLRTVKLLSKLHSMFRSSANFLPSLYIDLKFLCSFSSWNDLTSIDVLVFWVVNVVSYFHYLVFL